MLISWYSAIMQIKCSYTVKSIWNPNIMLKYRLFECLLVTWVLKNHQSVLYRTPHFVPRFNAKIYQKMFKAEVPKFLTRVMLNSHDPPILFNFIQGRIYGGGGGAMTSGPHILGAPKKFNLQRQTEQGFKNHFNPISEGWQFEICCTTCRTYQFRFM